MRLNPTSPIMLPPGGGGSPGNPSPGDDECCLDGGCSSSRSPACANKELAKTNISWNCDHGTTFKFDNDEEVVIELNEQDLKSLSNGASICAVRWDQVSAYMYGWRSVNYVGWSSCTSQRPLNLNWESDSRIRFRWTDNSDMLPEGSAPGGAAYCENRDGLCYDYTKHTAYLILRCPHSEFPYGPSDIFDVADLSCSQAEWNTSSDPLYPWHDLDPNIPFQRSSYGRMTANMNATRLVTDSYGTELIQRRSFAGKTMQYPEIPSNQSCEEGIPLKNDFGDYNTSVLYYGWPGTMYHTCTGECSAGAEQKLIYKIATGVPDVTGNIRFVGEGHVCSFTSIKNCWKGGRFEQTFEHHYPDSLHVTGLDLEEFEGTWVGSPRTTWSGQCYYKSCQDLHDSQNFEGKLDCCGCTSNCPIIVYTGFNNGINWNEPFGYTLKGN